MLIDVIGAVLTGGRIPPSPYNHDPVEMKKIITTLAIECACLVLLDNVTGPFGNPPLDIILTAEAWKDRIMGGNHTFVGPMRATWFATGNNVQPTCDMARRCCRIRLEASRRASGGTLRLQACRPARLGASLHRTALLAAALTILLAICCAGRPPQTLAAWGSFQGWTQWVCAALVWAGQEDPGKARLAKTRPLTPTATPSPC